MTDHRVQFRFRFAACKKLWALVLLGLCLVFPAGCGSADSPQNEKEVSVYYINKAETKITPVMYELQSDSENMQVEEIIEALTENPVELSLRTPINGYTIEGWEIVDKQLILDVSEEYRRIQATTEVLIRAALVRTFTQIQGIDHVAMTVNGEALTDSLGGTVGPMTADMFIDNAGNEINSYEKVRLKLYFANETGDRLVESSVVCVYNSNISMEKLVVEQLVAGPPQDMEGAWPVINPATKILSVTVKDGTCYVNLDDGFMTQMYNVTGDVVIYSIVNSLVELSNVNKVQIAVNGETDLVYREVFNLSTVFDRNLDLVYGTQNDDGT
ncbi:MAG: GerMN domain-containing protein [Eubacteriales bacterium]|nr:GerMN domain-containing protein [Eubacteriales bacterium]